MSSRKRVWLALGMCACSACGASPAQVAADPNESMTNAGASHAVNAGRSNAAGTGGSSAGGATNGAAGGTTTNDSGPTAASSGGNTAGTSDAPSRCAAFEHDLAAGRTLLCIGQDTGEIEAYGQAIAQPGCVMLYTNVADLAGFGEEVNFGAGRQSLQHWLDKPEPLAIQLAVSLTSNGCDGDQLAAINSGSLDGAISSMAVELAASARPVLLRFGYEFDNTSCHAYEPAPYRQAFRHFAEQLRNLGALNVALVWHAWGGPPLDVSAWYPGDDVVDFVAVSDFPVGLAPGKLEQMATLAELHQKPLMIAESAPEAQHPLDSSASWSWFQELFDFVQRHDVRVLSYINQNWNAQSVWAAQGIWGDSRVQGSAVESQWRSAIAAPRFLSADSSLYRELGCRD